jgi:DNA-directed RNA polymerase subunit RPC12/RpoP
MLEIWYHYKCGSCGNEFSRKFPKVTDEDLSSCPCDKCGAQSSETKTYRVYRDNICEKNLIANLLLETIKEIHGDNIASINHNARRVVVKYEISEETWDDIKVLNGGFPTGRRLNLIAWGRK